MAQMVRRLSTHGDHPNRRMRRVETIDEDSAGGDKGGDDLLSDALQASH